MSYNHKMIESLSITLPLYIQECLGDFEEEKLEGLKYYSEGSIERKTLVEVT